MPIKLIEEAKGKLISVTVNGQLTKQDYENFVPEVEELIKKFGKIDILLTLHDFHGWDGGALWQDIKFDLKHFSDIRRLAIVGDKVGEVDGRILHSLHIGTDQILRSRAGGASSNLHTWPRGARA